MTIHEALFSTVRQPLLGILYLLLTLQMALLLAAFRTGRSCRIRIFLLLHLMFSFACLWFPLMDIDSNPFRTDAPIPLPAARSAVTLLPVWVLFLYEGLTALILVFVIHDFLRFRRKKPTFESIKETMDLLPAGIAFCRPDGTVVFSNIAMNGLSRELTGKRITNLTAFKEAAGAAGQETQIALPGGSAVWQIAEKTINVDGTPYIQLTATDITGQAEITRKLEEKNKTLRDIHMRLDIYNKQAERIIIAQELLSARMSVHNEVGNVLLESRHYLTDPVSIDEELLLLALKNTNTYLLKEYEEDDTSRDPLVDAIEMARAIGVDVEITGIIPVEDPCRRIAAAAISECAANTVKHAGGNSLQIDVSSTDTELICILRNNGKQPEEPIQETGGLLSLRNLVEREGGDMQTAISHGFCLTLHLPAGQ